MLADTRHLRAAAPLSSKRASCETDDDGVLDLDDNCPAAENADQADCNNDGVGDACIEAGDRDNDGVENACDNCIDVENADQADTRGFCADGTRCGDNRCDVVVKEDLVTTTRNCTALCRASGSFSRRSTTVTGDATCVAAGRLTESGRPFVNFAVGTVVQCECTALVGDGVGDACDGG